MNKSSSETKLSRSPSVDGKQPTKQDEKESKSSSKKESSESKVSRSSSVDSKSSKSDESKPNKSSESRSKNVGESYKSKSQDSSSKIKSGESKVSKAPLNENKNTKYSKPKESNEKSSKSDNEKKTSKKISKEFSEKSRDKSKDKKDDENRNKTDKNNKIKSERKKSSSDNKEPIPPPEPKPKKKISSQKDGSQQSISSTKQMKDGKTSANPNDNITVDQLFLAIEPETIDNPCLIPTHKYELLLETNIPVQGFQENIAYSHFIPSTHLRNINYYFNQRSLMDKDYFKDLSRINQLITPTSQYFNEYTQCVVEMQKNELYKRQLDNIEQFNSFIEAIHDSKVPFSNFIPT